METTKRPRQRSHDLPVTFHPLDLEAKTRPVPSLVCPERRDLMTVGNCARCRDFCRIDFSQAGQPLLRCETRAVRGGTHLSERVQDLLRVPVLCAAPDTTLQSIVSFLDLGMPRDAIPVLDLDARPIGVLSIQDIHRLIRGGIPLQTTVSEVMSRLIVCVLPETALTDAAQLLLETQSAQLFAVTADGTFLGLLAEHDLSTTATRTRSC
jgi:CBS domain-containing protein